MLFLLFLSVGSCLDISIFFLCIELSELGLLLVVVDGADHDDDDDGDQDGDTLDPGDLWVGGVVGGEVLVVAFRWLVCHAIVLVDAQGNGDQGSDQKQDLIFFMCWHKPRMNKKHFGNNFEREGKPGGSEFLHYAPLFGSVRSLLHLRDDCHRCYLSTPYASAIALLFALWPFTRPHPEWRLPPFTTLVLPSVLLDSIVMCALVATQQGSSTTRSMTQKLQIGEKLYVWIVWICVDVCVCPSLDGSMGEDGFTRSCARVNAPGTEDPSQNLSTKQRQ